jgi:3-hydroxyacyl-[acyl-carrier-protein] dehydratase
LRYFLLDRVTAVTPGESARGVKNVTLTDEVLHDHFPDHPMLPGALIVEAAAQLSGFLLELSLGDGSPRPRRAVLVQIEKAKFYRPAEPGDQIEIKAELRSTLETAAQVAVEAEVGGERVMRATLTFMMKTVDSERVHDQRRRLYRLWTKSLDPKVPLP